MSSIDLNADVGELETELDAAILEVVSSVSIACGGHAGDDETMTAVATMAAERGVRIGAHPSYVDRDTFGRTRHHITAQELRKQLREQIERLISNSPQPVTYVKPHGALYHAAAMDMDVARTVVDAAQGLALMGQPGALYLELGRTAGIPVIHEAFADRAYSDDGRLLPRSEPGAVLTPSAALDQVTAIARGEVQTINGRLITMRAQSVCLHSDTPGAATLARQIATHLAALGVAVRA